MTGTVNIANKNYCLQAVLSYGLIISCAQRTLRYLENCIFET